MVISQQIEHAPRAAGVYLFFKGTKILYVGKAERLKSRLFSYFRKDAPEKARRLVAESSRVEWRKTESEIEAIIHEAELIKRHHPKYNYTMRDDKSYAYVAFTREPFPRIFKTHEPRGTDSRSLRCSFLGPFTGGSKLKIALKLLRKIFPYCTCKTSHMRSCLNAQIGACPGYCCLKRNQGLGDSEQEEYKNNIKNIKAVLTGRKKNLLKELKKEMRAAAKKQEFEKAALLRDQAESVENIFRHRMTLERAPQRSVKKEQVRKVLSALFQTKKDIARAEGYDISNISGTAATGSMVVFLNGKPAKSEYRIFNIKTVNQISDVNMMREVIVRRLRHPEWQYPDLMVIDGGKPQLSAALNAVGSRWPVVGGQKLRTTNHEPRTKPLIVALAKREEELYFPNKKFPVRLDALPAEAQRFFKHIRDEAHRFARKQHHKIRSRALRPLAPLG